ncbi:hypothetical protein V3C33_10265 [Micrococcaceae bacterium Sec5.7]
MHLFSSVYVQGAAVVEGVDRAVMASHGVGVVRERLVTRAGEAQRVLDTHAQTPLWSIGQDIKGSLTLYVSEKRTKRVTVLPDPLGGGIIYMHRDADGTAISSDLGGLVRFLTMLGKPPRKSLAYVASYVATGSGGLIQSSYEGITALEQFAYLEVSSAGVRTRTYPVEAEVFQRPSTYKAGLEAVRADVEENIRAIASAGRPVNIAHLTGGVDSRAVLAAILATGVKEQFSFYCSGGPREPDRIVAECLAVHYGLTMSNYSGYSETSLAESFDETLLSRFQHTSGIISGVASARGRPGTSTVSSGGYGELFRSSYNHGRPHGKSLAETAERMFGRVGMSVDPARRLLADPLVRELRSRLGAVLGAAAGHDVRSDARLDYVYLNKRNRYFMGEISRSLSPFAARMDPLYSINGAKLALSISGVEREANIVGMDLIEQLSPGLSLLPFDRDRFGGAFGQLRGRPMTKDFEGYGPPEYVSRGDMNADRVGYKVERPTEEQITRAVALKMTPRLVAQFPHVQAGLGELIAAIPNGEFGATFNHRSVRLLMQREPGHRVHFRTARNLYAALLWYVHG